MTMFFYTDPYSPWERGSNEINNRFLRKEITKGQAINDYSSTQIIATNNWVNHYPRAMFNGRSAMDVYCKAFYQEMSRSHQPIIKLVSAIYFSLVANLFLKFRKK